MYKPSRFRINWDRGFFAAVLFFGIYKEGVMRKQLFFWELAGFLFTAAVGSLLHFVYQWSGSSTWRRPFPPSTSPPGSI